MERFPHVVVNGTSTTLPYTSTRTGGGGREYSHPPRDRERHADKLITEIVAAADLAKQRTIEIGSGVVVKGLSLECVSSLGDQLESPQLDDRTAKIELLSTRTDGERTYATVFVPEGRLHNFLRKIEKYKTETDERRKDKGPKNKSLVESIESIRLPLVRSFWTDLDADFPGDPDAPAWFEVWIRLPPEEDSAASTLGAFRTECLRVGIRADSRETRFPERAVVIAYGTSRQWSQSLSLLGELAELRRAKLVPTDFVEMPPRDMAAFVEDAAERMDGPTELAPAVCILDTGVHNLHPLLSASLSQRDVHVIDPSWPATDDVGHGTEMAGLAVFGDRLAEHLAGKGRLEVRHRLESVKFLHPIIDHDPSNYGSVTVEALAIAELAAPLRARVACLAVTADDRDMGFPSSWSSALDQHSSGAMDDQRRLYVVSAGNVRDTPFLAPQYPHLNRSSRGIEDPGQSWNALTVGALTERVIITSPEFAVHTPVAPKGGLCPTSRTSMMWTDDDWPLKPDVVMEGGNYAAENNGEVLRCDDLRLLTTSVYRSGRLLETMADTSAATAQAARLAARLMEAYPQLWPETIRGLIVHSADWTERMVAEFPNTSKAEIKSRLRCYGYGVPNETQAFWTARNAVTLIAQESLTPFQRDQARPKTRDCHVHSLPWPQDVLESLGSEPVTVRVTLSYFVEPSPGRRGWTRKFRYASHGLRFAVRGAVESDDAFTKRITRSAWSEGEMSDADDRPDTAELQQWLVGKANRTRGSVHSDRWTAPAVEVARCGKLAVYPVTGWWRERHHMGRVERDTRYSLIVSISTPESNVDLLTPIRSLVPIRTVVDG